MCIFCLNPHNYIDPDLEFSDLLSFALQISEALHDGIKYDENLVGVKIKVWWPDDEK